jgi:hypothetical protein
MYSTRTLSSTVSGNAVKVAPCQNASSNFSQPGMIRVESNELVLN